MQQGPHKTLEDSTFHPALVFLLAPLHPQHHPAPRTPPTPRTPGKERNRKGKTQSEEDGEEEAVHEALHEILEKGICRAWNSREWDRGLLWRVGVLWGGGVGVQGAEARTR